MEGKRSRPGGPVAGRRSSVWVAAALAAAVALAGGAAHGAYTVVAENGPASNRVNLVLLGDGYTADQIDTVYAPDVDELLDYVFGGGQDPFGRYRNFFNIYRVDVISAESGADVPPLGIYRDTALDGSYYYDGVTERLLYIDQAKADAVLAANGISGHLRWVLVNDTRYGGAGSGYAVFAAGHASAGELALHETGHSFSGLADEYVDPNNGSAVYSGPEPYEANVTKDPSGTKWAQWLGYEDSLGVVGAYEGARYYAYGLYRPTPTSKMKALGEPFNAVSREKIVQDIYANLHPLDGFLKVRGVLVDPSQLWIDAIDPNVQQIDWYVDDVIVPGASGETFRLQDYGYGPGQYSVYVQVWDPTEWVRVGRDAMEQGVGWTVELTPEPASVSLVLIGASVLLGRHRRRREPVSATRR